MSAPADSIPVEVIRQAVADSGISNTEIARRLGWFRNCPDTGKLRRALGQAASGGSRPPQKSVTYERALEIISATGLDPVDYGL